MKLKHYTIHKAIFLITSILLCNTVLAQSEKDTISQIHKNEILEKHNLSNTIFDAQPNLSEYPTQFSSFESPIELGKFEIPEYKNSRLKKLSFKQSKIENDYFGLGTVELYNNNLKYKLNNKIVFEFGIGLLKQNTIYSPNGPNFQASFHASTEYAITN